MDLSAASSLEITWSFLQPVKKEMSNTFWIKV